MEPTKRKPILDPPDRMSEILFGLIMVLTFTSSLSAASSGRAEVRTMLFAAISCNAAWGLVDGILYVVGNLIDRARRLALLRGIQEAKDTETVRRLVGGELPATVASALDTGACEAIRSRVAPAHLPTRAKLTFDDVRAAAAIFLLVFLSTFPVVLPFIFIRDTLIALRVSNAIALVALFMLGYRLAPYTMQNPFRMGLATMGIGIVLVAITVVLGG